MGTSSGWPGMGVDAQNGLLTLRRGIGHGIVSRRERYCWKLNIAKRLDQPFWV
jgi:hypothetical protein